MEFDDGVPDAHSPARRPDVVDVRVGIDSSSVSSNGSSAHEPVATRSSGTPGAAGLGHEVMGPEAVGDAVTMRDREDRTSDTRDPAAPWASFDDRPRSEGDHRRLDVALSRGGIGRSTGDETATPRRDPPWSAASDLGRDASTDDDKIRERVVVRRGDTLIDILLRAGIGRAEAHEALASLQSIYDPRRLRVGQHLDLELDRAARSAGSAKLDGLSINLDFENDLRVARAPAGGFDVSKNERDLTRDTMAAVSVIDDSLYMAGRRAGVHDDAIMQFIRLLSWDVDFQHDIRSGNTFEIVYDVLIAPDGGESRVDTLHYARLDLEDRTLTAYRFAHADGRVGYYDENGKSLRKWLMRTPIDGARLSSGFGKRQHPVLGYTKMHKGVDFAAPRGTPIYAAGDGVVVMAQRNGSFGNYIRIRHNSDYQTAYAHLNGFAPELAKGTRVTQGDVIGYVGTTGRSTGPHLHYEVLEDGRQINPMKVKVEVADHLNASEMSAFRAQIAAIASRIDDAERERQLAQAAR